MGIGCAALFLLVVGSWTHKMVGVEIVHVLQLIFYLHYTLHNYSLPFSSLQSLSLLAVTDLHWQTQHQNVYLDPLYAKTPLSPESSSNTMLFLAIPALFSIIVFTIYLAAQHYGTPTAAELARKIAKKVYHCFTFPVAMAFVPPYLLAQATLNSRSTGISSTYPL